MGEVSFSVGETCSIKVQKVFTLHSEDYNINMHPKLITTLLLCILFPLSIWGQDTITSPIKKRENTTNKAASKLYRSLEEQRSDKEIAEDYIKLAKELSGKADYTKAEDYLNRARTIYVRLNDKDNIAGIDRELAKIKESQNKISDAINLYSAAASLSQNQQQRALNTTDYYRLNHASNPQAQAVQVQKKLDILNEQSSNFYMNNSSSKDSHLDRTSIEEDKTLAYKQMAQINMNMGDKKEAINQLSNALEVVKNKPEEAIAIKQEIANTYAADDQIDKALEINKELVKEARKTNNARVEINQLQNLSSNLFEANKIQEGITTLQQAYALAVNEGRTIDAKNILNSLIEQYNKSKDTKKALESYADFIDRLEELVKNDSTLIDEKFFQVQEARILQLEKERVLQNELIQKTNTFNYVLLAFIILILISLAFIAKALFSIKKKNKKIALQSLRREMNPHFIFNSLNSVNQFIAQNNELEANKYLSSYSKLMRNIMENSNKDFIPLAVEMEQMKEYLDLEHLRFNDKFDYSINVDESLDTDSIFIPNMLIQPQLENAVWHGLRYKEGKGLLSLSVKAENNKLIITVEDNGIGRHKSQELKTKHQREHKSRGLTNTQERINLLNSLYHTSISINITDKKEPVSGVIVTLQFPLMDKNK